MGETFHNLKKMARELKLHTVCESVQCPTSVVLEPEGRDVHDAGNLCTRRCGFCAVPKVSPSRLILTSRVGWLMPLHSSELHHAVITSVNRDDDNLGAAQAFVQVVEEIRLQTPGCRMEILTPDFQGVEEALRLVVAARPEILNDNIETVPSLIAWRSPVDGMSGLWNSCEVEEIAAEMFSDRDGDRIGQTKTGIIVGMGEEMHELLSVFRDLADRKVGHSDDRPVLRPSRDHLPMTRYYTPDEFAFLKHEALGMGFRHVESGPSVRSSYHAQEQAERPGWRSYGHRRRSDLLRDRVVCSGLRSCGDFICAHLFSD